MQRWRLNMEFFEELKNKAKNVANQVDWDDLNQKKDAVIDGAIKIKDDYELQQRKKKEDWLYKKEIELKAREEIIEQKEIKLSRQLFFRTVQFFGSISLIGFASLFIYFEVQEKPVEPSMSTYLTNITKNKYPPRVRSAYEKSNNIYEMPPNFDIGLYCKEKQSDINFEECLAVTAAKITNNLK